MSIQLIGILTILAGTLCFWRGQNAVITAVIVASVFGAAAALYIGQNDIGPAQLLLAFGAVSLLLNPDRLGDAFRQLQFPRAGFWLICLVGYGVASSFLLPRLFTGVTDIIPLGTPTEQYLSAVVPLAPVSSNFTQSVYMLGNLTLFVMVAAAGSSRDGFRAMTFAVIAYGLLNTFFAVADLVSFNTGTQDVLGFIRNARYTLHHEEQIFGLKRIVGAFTEASSFSRSTIGVLAFTGTLWLCGRYRPVTGAIAFASVLLVALSTSSSGLVVLPVILGLLFVTGVSVANQRPENGGAAALLVVSIPIFLGVLVVALALNNTIVTAAREYVDIVVTNKMSSDSGVTRGSWNEIGLQNFLDTWGIGVGLGTNRVSSFAIALISNLGVAGVCLYLLFAHAALFQPDERPGTFPYAVKLAARNAAIGLTVADLLVGPTIDQGLLFYALAGLAAAKPDELLHLTYRRRPSRKPVFDASAR